MAVYISRPLREGLAGHLGPGEFPHGHEQAICDERAEDVRLNALHELMEDGPDGKIVLAGP